MHFLSRLSSFLGLICLLSVPLHGADGKASPSREDILGLQIYLENIGFSPGILDGRLGVKTILARQMAESQNLPIKPMDSPIQKWTLPKGFLDDLVAIPQDWASKSKLERMGYETPLEKITETFHITEKFLKTLNPRIKDWKILKEGDSLWVPQLNLQKLLKANQIKVSLSKKTIIAIDTSDREYALFHCSIAAKKEKRPVGKLEVKVIAPDPDYLFDPALFQELPEAATLKSKLMISPGPNNPVGSMWIGLNLKGYGIHGTPWPEAIGKTESHGCFRLTNWDAQRLGFMVRIGTPVLIEE